MRRSLSRVIKGIPAMGDQIKYEGRGHRAEEARRRIDDQNCQRPNGPEDDDESAQPPGSVLARRARAALANFGDEDPKPGL